VVKTGPTPAGGTKTPIGGTKTPVGGTKTPAGGTKPITSTVLTEEQIQAELDRAKALEGTGAPPEGAVDNGNGTYSVFEDGMITTYDSSGVITGMVADTNVNPAEVESIYDEANQDAASGGGDGETIDTTSGDGVSEGSEGTQYFQDGEGNYYTMNDDGGYDLAYYADGSIPEDAVEAEEPEFTSYTDPDTGAEWTLGGDGEWTTDFNYDDYTNYPDGTDYVDNADYAVSDDYVDNGGYTDYNDYTDYSGEEYAKRGGLMTMMNKGGVAGYAPGGDVFRSDVQYTDNGDNSYTYYDENRGYVTVDYNGNEISSTLEDPYPVASSGTYDTAIDDVTVRKSVDNKDGTYTQYYSDGTYYTFDDPEYGTVYDPNVTTKAVATSGNPFSFDNIGNTVSKGFQNLTGASDETVAKIIGALPAAGAGALVASLLGNDSGGGEQYQGFDMSKVGAINPRTTDFGIGPTNFVGYEDYGTSGDDYTPNEELLRNLNAPGYNPVNEGDYGYEEVAADEEVAAEGMASGGLSSMATPVSSYYTFGQPADILANLGMRPQPPMNPPEMMTQVGQQQPAQQAQQQRLPQQAPPMAPQQMSPMMPQQGMPPQMRRGGLSHVSNVPMTQGRMDFRQGSAVHGEGDGQSDDIPAMLADGEYVFDSEIVAQIGNGSTKAGAQALDRFRENIRAHKRSAPINKIPPKTKVLTSYLKGAR